MIFILIVRKIYNIAYYNFQQSFFLEYFEKLQSLQIDVFNKYWLYKKKH